MIVANIPDKAMDKSDTDSVASINMKGHSIPELATITRSYSVTSEPPPYKKPVSNSVRIARLVAITVVAVAAILGAAIILAAYIQTQHSAELAKQQHLNEKLVQQVQATTTPAPVSTEAPSALTSEDVGLSSDERDDVFDEDEDKGQRRLDTEPDLLEELLEQHSKILRLPVGKNDLDIEDLTDMFLGGNKPANTKCFVQRKPIGGDSDDMIKIPIRSNSTAMPILARLTGERVSIICRNTEEIQSDLLPFDMPQPSPLSFHQGGFMAMPLNRMISQGPFVMRENGMPPLRSLPPLAALNPFLKPLAPVNPSMRSFLPAEPSLGIPSFRPFGPVPNFQQTMMPPRSLVPPPPPEVPSSLLQPSEPIREREPERRLIPDRPLMRSLPFPLSLNGNHVPIERTISPAPLFNVPNRPVASDGINGPLFNVAEQQGKAPFFRIPPRNLNLPMFNVPQPSPVPRPTGPADPVFHVPRPSVEDETEVPDQSTDRPDLVPGRSANAARRIRFDDIPTPIRISAFPIPLPFLQSPAQSHERSSPVPVNIPFLNVHDIDEKADEADSKFDDDEEDESEEEPRRPSLFERLLGSLKLSRSPKLVVLPTNAPVSQQSTDSNPTAEAQDPSTTTARPEISVRVVLPKDPLDGVEGGNPTVPIGVKLPVIPPHFQDIRIPIVLRPEERTSRMMKMDPAADEAQEDDEGEQKDNSDLIQPR